MKRCLCLVVAMFISAGLAGCAHFESHHVNAVALQGPQTHRTYVNCSELDASPSPPPYTFGDLKDCTAKDTLIVFSFSGGGMRSASFGYGVLAAAHTVAIPDETGSHPLDRDIDIVSGVSGGSFTAAAFATHREALFPAPGGPDYYRDNFLTHDFNPDLADLYLAPWHWHGLLPMFDAEEMATLYGGIEFSSPSDKLFAPSFGDLARKGRPFLVVQATDIANEQSFTFTQYDFDLICADVNRYPVTNAIAASSAVPILFSPIRLENHHSDAEPGEYCATHRPSWIDEAVEMPQTDFSRLFTRAGVAERFLPDPQSGAPVNTQQVVLQDGGVADNLALRGLQNILAQYLERPGSDTTGWTEEARETACRQGADRIGRVLFVAVDGGMLLDNRVFARGHSLGVGQIVNATTSSAMMANNIETMLATDILAKRLAAHLAALRCPGSAAHIDDRWAAAAKNAGSARSARVVTSYFAHISFDDLDPQTALPAAACDKRSTEHCTLHDLSRSETRLSYSSSQVDALIEAGRSAFICNRELAQFLKDSRATIGEHADLACKRSRSATLKLGTR